MISTNSGGRQWSDDETVLVEVSVLGEARKKVGWSRTKSNKWWRNYSQSLTFYAIPDEKVSWGVNQSWIMPWRVKQKMHSHDQWLSVIHFMRSSAKLSSEDSQRRTAWSCQKMLLKLKTRQSQSICHLTVKLFHLQISYSEPNRCACQCVRKASF